MLPMHKVAEIVGVNYHTVRKTLIRNDVPRSKKGRIKHSDETKKKSSLSRKGKPSGRKGIKVTNPETLFKNMKAHLKPDVDLEWLMKFELPKLMSLNKMVRNDRVDVTREWYVKYIERFHDDPQFNKVYETWLASNKEHLAQPTLDHMLPISRGGSNDVDNLQVISWIENRMKSTMTKEEWISFKILADLKSTYVYEN